MQITDQELDRLAELSRLQLPAERRETMKRDLASILSYVERLPALEPLASGVAPRAVATLREDVPAQEVGVRDAILEEAPDAIAAHVRVPAVFDRT